MPRRLGLRGRLAGDHDRMRTSLERRLSSAPAWHSAVHGLLAGLLALVLAACSTAMGPSAPGPTAAITPQGGATGQRQPVKIALLLPLGGMGETAAIAKSMKQAAEMALFEVNDPNVQLITKDDHGTAAGGRAAADAAIKEGAEIILGPLFSHATVGAAPVARQAGVPILTFSNDTQVAGNGVYLMSFIADEEVERVVSFAARQGKRRFAALIPDNAYGKVVEPAFRKAVQKAGGTVVIVERYPPAANGMLGPAKRVVQTIKRADELLNPVDALFLPGGQEALPQIGPVIAYNGLDTRKVKLLGTGAWDFPSIGRDDAFVGGWYPSPDPNAWRAFTERFARTFGSTPPRIASVAYDAVNLAIGLSSNPPGTRYTAANLTRSQGFSGVDGIVRFGPNGLSERGLAVLEVQKFGTSVVAPAPSSFQPTKLSEVERTVR
jgi:branched-chain amino acid transport system substrate-binding protein